MTPPQCQQDALLIDVKPPSTHFLVHVCAALWLVTFHFLISQFASTRPVFALVALAVFALIALSALFTRWSTTPRLTGFQGALLLWSVLLPTLLYTGQSAFAPGGFPIGQRLLCWAGSWVAVSVYLVLLRHRYLLIIELVWYLGVLGAAVTFAVGGRLPFPQSAPSPLPEMTPGLFLTWTLLTGLVVFFLARVTFKDARKHRGARWFKAGSLFLALNLLFVILMLYIWPAMTLSLLPPLIALTGMQGALRELAIARDTTLYPRERRTPVTGYLEEAALATRSLTARLLRKKPHAPSSQTPDARWRELRPHTIRPGGDRIYRPYLPGEPHWIPVCLHMHSNRWEGKFTAEEMVDHFAGLGAGSVILTDHNRITRPDHLFAGPPTYEHGWGPHHHHVLALDARHRLIDTCPFGSTHQQKQQTLQALRRVAPFLILAHPHHHHAWTAEDIAQLDYDAVEVFNKSCRSEVEWDTALSANRAVWGTAGDDCHDLRSRHQTGKRFLLIDARLTLQELRNAAALIPESEGTGGEYWSTVPATNKDSSGSVYHFARQTDQRSRPLPHAVLLYLLHLGRFASVEIRDRFVTRSLLNDMSFTIRNFEVNDPFSLSITTTQPAKCRRVSSTLSSEGETSLPMVQHTSLLQKNDAWFHLYLTHGNTTMALNPVYRF